MQIIGLQNRFIGELHNPSSNFYLQYFIRLAYKKNSTCRCLSYCKVEIFVLKTRKYLQIQIYLQTWLLFIRCQFRFMRKDKKKIL